MSFEVVFQIRRLRRQAKKPCPRLPRGRRPRQNIQARDCLEKTVEITPQSAQVLAHPRKGRGNASDLHRFHGKHISQVLCHRPAGIPFTRLPLREPFLRLILQFGSGNKVPLTEKKKAHQVFIERDHDVIPDFMIF